jgi:DNA ligase 1
MVVSPALPLSSLSTAHAELASTSSKLEKVRVLTELLQRCDINELPVVVAAMTGEPRQGRIGIGWATFARAEDSFAPAGNAQEEGPTVAELDRLILAIAASHGDGSQTNRSTLLRDFLNRCTELEVAFVNKLLTGGLRQGALHGLMVEAVAKTFAIPPAKLRKALTLHGDLGALAVQLFTAGPSSLDSICIVPGRAMQPMLAATAPTLAAAMEELGNVSVEWKLDGARIQVHIFHEAPGSPRIVRLFTRNLNDITSRLPDVIRILEAIEVDSLVADGEVLGLDLDGNPAIFQDTMARVGSDERARQSVVLQPFLFDLLHLNGRDLVNVALHERIALLDSIAPTLRVPGVITDDLAVAQKVQAEALRLSHEGVMVKSAMSTYDAGRRGSAWRKVKPVKTLDLVVLAAEWGHGRRSGKLSNLHLGARGPDGCIMVGKTFKGLTDKLLEWQTEQFLQREIRREGITIFVRPELVVEIALDGVQRSTRYPGGVALRFARVKGYRPDRTSDSADTIETVQALLPEVTNNDELRD